MAKEQWHNWARYLMVAVAIVFAGGGYVMKINANSSNIDKNEMKIEKVEDDVHIIELNQRDDAAVKSAILSILNRLETEQKTMRNAVQNTAIIIKGIQGKVDNLTRDD